MSAKPKIEVVQTARDRLRGAYTKLKSLNATSSELRERIAKLAPLDAAVAGARSELERIEQADSDAMRAWVDRGADGAPPVPNNTGRVDAARKLASAEASLKAVGVAKDSLESQLVAVNVELRDFTPEYRATQIEAIGEEIFLAVEKMRQASIALLESEAYHLGLLAKLRHIRNADAGGHLGASGSAPVNVAFSYTIERIKELNKLSNEERATAAQSGNQKAQQVIGLLLADEDPKE
jgi:hypothetical protein